MTWRDIASAPRTEEHILAWSKEDGIAIVRWYDRAIGGPRFTVWHDAEDYAYREYDPSHWMPLRETPEGGI